MAKPDALSRRPDHRPEGGVEPDSVLKPHHFRKLAATYYSVNAIAE